MGKTGIESLANFDLLRSHTNLIEQTADEIMGRKSVGDNVVTTLNVNLQQIASDALGKNRDAVIAISGAGKKELLGKSVSPELEQVMTRRSLYCGDGVPVAEGNGTFRAAVAAPILCEGDVLGAVLFLSPDGRTAGETECKLAQTVAAFLGKNMES